MTKDAAVDSTAALLQGFELLGMILFQIRQIAVHILLGQALLPTEAEFEGAPELASQFGNGG